MTLRRFIGINRYMCDVLNELKEITKGHIKGNRLDYVHSLIEEIRSMGSRMEAALEDKGDIERLTNDRQKIKKDIRELESKLNTAKQMINDIVDMDIEGILEELKDEAKEEEEEDE